MYAHDQITLLVHKMRLHPVNRFAGVAGGIRQDKPTTPNGFHFNNTGNFDRTNLPTIHALNFLQNALLAPLDQVETVTFNGQNDTNHLRSTSSVFLLSSAIHREQEKTSWVLSIP